MRRNLLRTEDRLQKVDRARVPRKTGRWGRRYIEREMEHYKNLKAGRIFAFEAYDLDSLGEVLVKARIARGLTQAELAKELEMSQQQIQRYEREGYQKISLWRLSEIAGALAVEFSVHARLLAADHSEQSYLGQAG